MERVGGYPVGVQPKPQQVSGWLHGHRWGFRELRGLWLWEAKGEACAEGGWITCSTGGCAVRPEN